jgi:hypothetical protein
MSLNLMQLLFKKNKLIGIVFFLFLSEEIYSQSFTKLTSEQDQQKKWSESLFELGKQEDSCGSYVYNEISTASSSILEFTEGSGIVTVNHKNHGYKSGDQVKLRIKSRYPEKKITYSGIAKTNLEGNFVISNVTDNSYQITAKNSETANTTPTQWNDEGARNIKIDATLYFLTPNYLNILDEFSYLQQRARIESCLDKLNQERKNHAKKIEQEKEIDRLISILKKTFVDYHSIIKKEPSVYDVEKLTERIEDIQRTFSNRETAIGALQQEIIKINNKIYPYTKEGKRAAKINDVLASINACFFFIVCFFTLLKKRLGRNII